MPPVDLNADGYLFGLTASVLTDLAAAELNDATIETWLAGSPIASTSRRPIPPPGQGPRP